MTIYFDISAAVYRRAGAGRSRDTGPQSERAGARQLSPRRREGRARFSFETTAQGVLGVYRRAFGARILSLPRSTSARQRDFKPNH